MFQVNTFLDYFKRWTNKPNDGWFEGKVPGVPSNAIESTHRVMKLVLRHKKSRLSTFCHSQEKPQGLVYEWSRQRAPSHTVTDKTKGSQKVIANAKPKIFFTKPDYSDKYIDSADEFKLENNPVIVR